MFLYTGQVTFLKVPETYDHVYLVTLYQYKYSYTVNNSSWYRYTVQGGETVKSGLSKESEGRRRRGGSMDNLIDSVGEEINTNTR